MFKDNKEKHIEDLRKEQNKIAQGTTFKGEIESHGSFRVEGTVEGTLKTKGKVVIGETGFVNGTIECEYADVEGKFLGNMKVNATLSLKSKAHIEGEISTEKLAVEPGAIFNATCVMKGVKKLNETTEKKPSAKKKQTA